MPRTCAGSWTNERPAGSWGVAAKQASELQNLLGRPRMANGGEQWLVAGLMPGNRGQQRTVPHNPQRITADSYSANEPASRTPTMISVWSSMFGKVQQLRMMNQLPYMHHHGQLLGKIAPNFYREQFEDQSISKLTNCYTVVITIMQRRLYCSTSFATGELYLNTDYQ